MMNSSGKLEILSVILTNRCNLKCVYCGRNENQNENCIKKELTKEQWLSIFKDAQTVGLKKVNMTGGEIFCRQDCLSLIEETIKLGIKVSIETNGTIINESQIAYLSQFKDDLSISISLDGISPNTNDLTRGIGSFKRAMNTIKIIKDNGIPLRIITVLSNDNYDEIPDLARMIHEKMGLGFRLLPNIIEYGRGTVASEEYGVSYEKMMKLMNDFYFDFLRKHKNDINISVELNMPFIPLDIYKHSFCPWGKAMLGIGYSGNVALCHVAADNDLFVFDNVKNNSISDIWNNNEKLKSYKMMNHNQLHGVCGNCLARHLCRGGCRLYALTKYDGDFFAPDPFCQGAYDIGCFPDYALEDEKKNCRYNI